MSAYIVSHRQISLLAGYYANNVEGANVDWNARRLMAANARSINYRYQGSNENSKWVNMGTAREIARDASPVTVIKQVDNLNYQSCEYPEWEGSSARKILDRIEKIARAKLYPRYRNVPSHELPGYDDAPWGV